MYHSTLRFRVSKALIFMALLLSCATVFAQVTTSTITGLVSDKNGEALIGATVIATHVQSGTRYGTSTNENGRFTIPAVRVGGPFSVVVSYTGYEAQARENVYTNLGTATNLSFQMQESATALDEAVVLANRNDIFSSDRTGAATTFGKSQLETLPTIGSRSINSITKYNPNGNGSSFGGQDSRLNNFTIDGSVFNNGFGLGSDAQAGGRTGSTAISLDAIEELQVNIAPFDVRQSGFVGSGINAVTRSGTNDFSGSAYYNFRNNSSAFLGKKAAGQTVSAGKFDEFVTGIRIGGPILKNKLFFFANAEIVRRVEPATTFVADGSSLAGTTTRVKKADLDALRRYLKTNYNYETGEYENYDNETSSDKFLVRLDYNLNDRNKLTLRYTHHNSLADVLISNSNSLGAGSRRTNTDAMSFQNSGYLIGDNTRSIVGEWNSTLSDKLHNNLIVGYDFQNEDRKYKGDLFPTIDILQEGRTYISAGFDPFTPDNQLDYGTFHITDNVNIYKGRHTFTVGANYDRYRSNNLFFPGSHGVYIFNSLQDFYSASDFHLANPTADTSNVNIRRFQYRYSALPDGEKPLQVLKANKIDLYGQDQFQVTNRFALTLGVRASYVAFENTALTNEALLANRFYSESRDSALQINTGNMPKAKILWEPRLGFNLDVTGNRSTQIRGGTGIFTGRPPYVWVSNQIGNNGVLTGFIDENVSAGSKKYGFTDDPSKFKPAQAATAGALEIAAADEDYRFPQIWKSNLAIDQKLPFGFVGSVEFLYNKNINAIKYYNANLKNANSKFVGDDTRDRWTSNRVYSGISSAVIMTNTNEGGFYSATLKLEYPQQKGLYGMAAYTHSKAEDLMSAGSIAAGSWNSVRTTNGNNNLSLAYADQDQPNRVIGLLGYRIEYGKRFGGATSFSLGYIGENRGFNPSAGIQTARYSYSIAGDMNGDGSRDNELLYVPAEGKNLVFEKLEVKNSAGAVIASFTAEEQAAAFDAYIKQDEYLTSRRGQYAARNSSLFPMLHRFDFSIMQEVIVRTGGKPNRLQFRFDILNFSNLLNNDWGVGNVLVTDRPISFSKVGADGVPVYKMATQSIFNPDLQKNETKLLRDTFVKGVSPGDVWNAQFSIRYIFN